VPARFKIFGKGAGIVRKNLFWLSDKQWKRIERHLPTGVRSIKRANDVTASGWSS